MIKFLIIIDSNIDYLPQIKAGLLEQQYTYKLNGVDIEYELLRQDLSNIPWLDSTNAVSYSWLGAETLKLKQSAHPAYSVVYIFHYDNWKPTGGVGGWHMGNYNGYQVQLIKGFKDNPVWLYRTLMMEGLHSWDSPIASKLGISLSAYLGVNDYDEDLVHGMYGQGITLSQEDSIRIFGQEYTKYDYSLLIKKISPLLNKIFPMNIYRHKLLGKEQYVQGQDGRDYHIANVATLGALKAMGVLPFAEPEVVTSVNDSGVDILCFNKE